MSDFIDRFADILRTTDGLSEETFNLLRDMLEASVEPTSQGGFHLADILQRVEATDGYFYIPA